MLFALLILPHGSSLCAVAAGRSSANPDAARVWLACGLGNRPGW